MPFQDITLNDGRKIPSIAFGTGSVNKGKNIHHYVEQAIETGFEHLDTAQFYQNEESIPIAIRESGLSRSDFWITSKYGFGNIRDALNASLRNLQLKYLDLYLVHTPTTLDSIEDTWKEFEKIRDEGLAKSIGISNFNVQELQTILKVARVKPAVNQIQLHPYNYSENKELLELHARHGIITEAYGSLAPITTYPNGPVDAPLKKAAERLGVTPTQVIFLWVKAKGAIIVTTSSSKQHLKEYMAVGDLPPLTEEEIGAIDEAGAQGPPSTFSFVRRFDLVRRMRILAMILIALVTFKLLFSNCPMGAIQ